MEKETADCGSFTQFQKMPYSAFAADFVDEGVPLRKRTSTWEGLSKD